MDFCFIAPFFLREGTQSLQNVEPYFSAETDISSPGYYLPVRLSQYKNNSPWEEVLTVPSIRSQKK
jgi:hypothetical protein